MLSFVGILRYRCGDKAERILLRLTQDADPRVAEAAKLALAENYTDDIG